MTTLNKEIEFIIAKFKQAGGYSELSDEQLRASIRDYLLLEHDRDMETLSVKMELENISNAQIDKQWYERQYFEIKKRLAIKIAEMAFTGDPELK